MAEYDEHAKNLLSHKIVLAHILSGTVAEFKGRNPEEIVPLIEGEPEVSKIAVRPGETNKGRKITGTSQKSKIPHEGTITYDVHFHVFTPNHREQVKSGSPAWLPALLELPFSRFPPGTPAVFFKNYADKQVVLFLFRWQNGSHTVIDGYPVGPDGARRKANTKHF